MGNGINMDRTMEISCPICKDGKLTIREWDYPETYYDPRDCGYEIIKQDCNCDFESEEQDQILGEDNDQ